MKSRNGCLILLILSTLVQLFELTLIKNSHVVSLIKNWLPNRLNAKNSINSKQRMDFPFLPETYGVNNRGIDNSAALSL